MTAIVQHTTPHAAPSSSNCATDKCYLIEYISQFWSLEFRFLKYIKLAYYQIVRPYIVKRSVGH